MSEPDPTFLSCDNPPDVIRGWMKRHKATYRKVCMKLGMSGPGRLANLLGKKDRFTEALVPGFAQLMELGEAETKIFMALVQIESLKLELVQARAALTLCDEEDQARSTISSRGRRKSQRALVDHLEQELEQLQRTVKVQRLLASALPASADGYQFLSSWVAPSVLEAARCRGFCAEPEWLVRRFGGAITVDEAAEALRTLRALGLLQDHDGQVKVEDRPVTTEPRVTSTAVRSYYEGIAARSKARLDELLADPQGWLGEMSRVGALTIALPASAIPKAAAAFLEFHKRLHELLEAQRGAPPEEVIQLYLHLFPLTVPESLMAPSERDASALATDPAAL
jgi:uncharacterized protein (TIGR02147 family)